MSEVINNDAIKAIDEKYQSLAERDFHPESELWLCDNKRSEIAKFNEPHGPVAAALAAAPNIIISLCGYCSYKDEEVKKLKADLKHFKATSKDAEKRLMKRLANARSE